MLKAEELQVSIHTRVFARLRKNVHAFYAFPAPDQIAESDCKLRRISL
jgi:3-methyladenine DNA glycosylase/8-oxoguanine DNA glycosylase